MGPKFGRSSFVEMSSVLFHTPCEGVRRASTMRSRWFARTIISAASCG